VIRLPERAVTRFFVPLIDVLILLFCLFLLMPFVSRPDAASPAPVLPVTAEDAQKLKDELANTRRQLDELRRQKANLGERLSVTVLEIDASTGKLFAPEAGGRTEVRDQTDATRIVNRAKFRANGKDVFVLILYPRERTGYPLRTQVDEYRRWFRDVAMGFDNPAS
jgi:hypothetical protein